MEQIKDVKGSFSSFGWLYWLLLSNSKHFPQGEKLFQKVSTSWLLETLWLWLAIWPSPGNIRYLGFIWILRRVKGHILIGSEGEGNGERLKGGVVKEIRIWKQGVEEVEVVQKERGMRAWRWRQRKQGGERETSETFFPFFNCLFVSVNL